jgi:hypothetical protein
LGKQIQTRSVEDRKHWSKSSLEAGQGRLLRRWGVERVRVSARGHWRRVRRQERPLPRI